MSCNLPAAFCWKNEVASVKASIAIPGCIRPHWRRRSIEPMALQDERADDSVRSPPRKLHMNGPVGIHLILVRRDNSIWPENRTYVAISVMIEPRPVTGRSQAVRYRNRAIAHRAAGG